MMHGFDDAMVDGNFERDTPGCTTHQVEKTACRQCLVPSGDTSILHTMGMSIDGGTP